MKLMLFVLSLSVASSAFADVAKIQACSAAASRERYGDGSVKFNSEVLASCTASVAQSAQINLCAVVGALRSDEVSVIYDADAFRSCVMEPISSQDDLEKIKACALAAAQNRYGDGS